MSFLNAIAFKPLILALIVNLIFDVYMDRGKTLNRVVYALIVTAFGCYYFAWRVFETLLWNDGSIAFWPVCVFMVEVMGCASGVLFLILMSRAPLKAAPFDREVGPVPEVWVDLLIPTYNEPRDILDKAIIAALNQNHRFCRVYVLDDGRREWVKILCEELGANYLTRSDNAHAKAGNMNAALAHCNGEFIAIMDADFAASMNFLSETLPYFSDLKVAIVQTPQVFYNPDVIQLNLALNSDWVDEQRFFFREIMAARARWDSAFSCGSCSVTRRSAIDTIGGFPVDSITEDMLTTLRLRRYGYHTVYLNEDLSLGLAADAADAYFTQRTRWARGHIQIAHLWKDYLGNPSLTCFQKAVFFPHHWAIMPIVAITASTVPFFYFLLGLSPTTKGSLTEAVEYAAPFFAIQQGYMTWIGNRSYIPIISAAINVFTSFKLFPSVLSSLIKPFGAPFRVTPKSSLTVPGTDIWTSGILAFIWIGTAIGIILNSLPSYRIIPTTSFFPVALVFSVFTMVNLTIAFWITLPRPYPRASFRFKIGKELQARTSKGTLLVEIDNMSVGGAGISSTRELTAGDHLDIQISDDVWIPGEIVRSSGTQGVRWLELSPLQYRRLVEFLFSGKFAANPKFASGTTNIYAKLLKSLWA